MAGRKARRTSFSGRTMRSTSGRSRRSIRRAWSTSRKSPWSSLARAMQYSSRAGENVLDLFGGSGSTLIAAEQTGRHAYLMELDALYCDVIVQRWEKFTGQKAQRMAASRHRSLTNDGRRWQTEC